MKKLFALVGLLICLSCYADESAELAPDEIKTLVSEVNGAQNKMMMLGSKMDDVDALFAMYSDDFTYIHEAYGGTYSRELLYGNASRNVKAGRYKLTRDRYRILNILPGLNAAAVERLELDSGKVHLSVFEFKGKKVSKITEYWK
ncbi:MAG TPA: hypothetical protein VEC06_12065 [Paucimonas sp.]|nr:hypothetical protein [Paucimonas sp.]